MSQPMGGSGAVSAVVLTGKFTVVAVVSLFAVAFVVSLVYLFAKRYSYWVLSLGLGLGLAQPAATHCCGLDAAVLESLPVTIFRSSDFDLKEVECAVCISELSDGDETRVLPKCRHRFHLHCIDMWFQSQSTCPLCRSPVVPDPSPGRQDVSYSPETVTGDLLFPDQIQSSNGCLKAGMGSPESPSSSISISLVIEIPRPQAAEGIPGPGEELKTPPSSTLRMLTRLCSSCSPGPRPSPRGRDIELGGTAESSTQTKNI